MARVFDELADLGQDGLDYARLRWASLRLAVVDRLSATLSKAFGVIVCAVFVVSAIAFLMVALALWIGEMLGHASLGFLVAGGGMLLLAVIGFFVVRGVADRGLIRHFVKMLFSEDDDYGTAG